MDVILVTMGRRARQLLFTLAASVPGISLFVLFPLWRIEHPGDPSLILRSERHLLWNRPLHAHLDAGATIIPVIAIIVVAIALVLVTLNND